MCIGSTSLQTRYADNLGALTKTSGCFDPFRVAESASVQNAVAGGGTDQRARTGRGTSSEACAHHGSYLAYAVLVQRFPFRIVMPQPGSLPWVYERQQL